MNSWKTFPATFWKCFPCKKVVEMLEEVVVGWRDIRWIMADEAKLCSSIHSIFEALVVWPTVRWCRGKESGPFRCPMPAAGSAVFTASHWFAEHNYQMESFRQDSEVIVNFRWQATMFLIFKALISFAKLLEPPLHCTFGSSSWAKCTADIDVASCFCCFLIHSKLKKIA